MVMAFAANFARLDGANTFTAGPQAAQAGAAGNVAVVAKGAAAQTANLQQWQDAAGTALAAVTAAGVFSGNGSLLTDLPVTSTSEGTWRFATGTVMADPGAGKLRFNNATISAATAVALSTLTDPGTDVAAYLRSLAAGDGLYIQDRDNSANWVRHVLGAAVVDNTTWFQLPVALYTPTSYGGVAPGNNAQLLVT